MINAFVKDATYLWQDGTTYNSVSASQTGIYAVEVTLLGCKSVGKKEVKFSSLPIFSLGKDTSICSDNSLLLNAEFPGAEYTWNDFTHQPTFRVSRSGTYSVSVSNECGTVKDTIVILAENCICRMYIPSAFSPNADGKNDQFKPNYKCATDIYEMKIYNRWGQMVYSTNNIAVGWTGLMNGKVQPAGVYVWTIKYRDQISGKITQQKGNILLIR